MCIALLLTEPSYDKIMLSQSRPGQEPGHLGLRADQAVEDLVAVFGFGQGFEAAKAAHLAQHHSQQLAACSKFVPA